MVLFMEVDTFLGHTDCFVLNKIIVHVMQFFRSIQNLSQLISFRITAYRRIYFYHTGTCFRSTHYTNCKR